jgi:hypothetical protein
MGDQKDNLHGKLLIYSDYSILNIPGEEEKEVAGRQKQQRK